MRKAQIAVLILMAGVVALAILNIYPLAAPLIAHHQTNGMVGVILTDLLTNHAQTPLGPYLPWIMIALGFLGFCIISYDLKHRRRTTHGSAHHAGRQEARKYYAPRTIPRRPGRALQPSTRSGPRGAFRLVLGKYNGRVVALEERQQYQHVLLTAPTGAGKSARVFLPNLLREMGTRSLFIGDLKNELYQITAGWLAQYMQVWLFAPLRSTSQGYNPLAHIKNVEDAQDFAECWVTNTGTSKNDDFWPNNAKLLITAMTLHLIASERTPALARLADVLTTSSFEEISTILSTTRSSEARRLARQFLENMAKNERLVGSVMTDIGNRFQLLASTQARAVTATNDIDFQEMIETPTAFFLSIPRSETRRYRPLLAVLTQQMIKTWERNGTNGIGCYLDEFTNIGYIPGYADFISTARSLKVSLLMAIQNFSQLAERYGREDAETIKANAVTHLLLPGAGLEETKYYSERIGDTTIATETINRRGSGLAEEITSSQGEARRRLMTPDELRTMSVDTMLMLEATAAPLILKTKPYFEDNELAARANIPYQVTRIRPEPARPMPSYAQGLPAAPAGKGQQAPPIVVDGDLDEEEDDDQDSQYILQE